MIDGRDRILPEQLFRGNFRPDIARARTHVAVGEFEPRARKGIRKLIGMLQESSRDFLVGGINAQREVGGQHVGCNALRGVVCVRHGACPGTVLRPPLMRARWALAQFPLVAKQMLEEVVVPFRRRGGPGHFQSTGNGVTGNAAAVLAAPAKALRLQVGGFGIRPHVGGIARAMGLAEGMPAGNQRHSLLIIHRHAAGTFRECLAQPPTDPACRSGPPD